MKRSRSWAAWRRLDIEHDLARSNLEEQQSLGRVSHCHRATLKVLADFVGHDLYQRLMGLCPSLPDESNTAYQTRLENAFQEFPDDWEELRRQKLIYVSYKPLTTTPPPRDFDLESYIASGLVSYTPLTYEDFLPASAAGIFQSNLDSNRSLSGVSGDRAAFEVALGTSVMDYFDMYQEEEDASLELVRSYFTRAT